MAKRDPKGYSFYFFGGGVGKKRRTSHTRRKANRTPQHNADFIGYRRRTSARRGWLILKKRAIRKQRLKGGKPSYMYKQLFE